MRVVLYARVSTQRQAEKDLSIPDQISQLKSYCGKQGYDVAEVFREEGASATDDNRPVFRRMVQYVFDPSHEVGAILVLTTSRFFRDALQARLYKRDLTKHGVQVIATTQEVSDDPSGKFVEGIFELQDQFESQMNGFHTLRGMKENARRGYFNGSTPPFGYRVNVISEGDKDRRVLVPDEQEVETVRRIFSLYVDGLDGQRVGVKRITQILNAEGRFSRKGKLWTKQRVQERLADTVYRGEFYFNRKDGRSGQLKPRSDWILVAVPPIVDEEVFDRAVKIREQNLPSSQKPPSVTSSPLLLTGVFFCDKCGARMQLETAKSNKYRYYNCSAYTRRGRDACPGHRVPQAEFEKLVLDHLASKVFSMVRVQQLVRRLVSVVATARAESRERADNLKRQISELEANIRKYLDAFEKGTMLEADAGARVRELRSEQDHLKLQLTRLTSSHTIPPYVHTTSFLRRFHGSLKQAFLTNAKGMGQRYIRLFVSRIVMSGSTLTIEANTAAFFGAACSAATKKGTAVELTTVPTVDLNWLAGVSQAVVHLAVDRGGEIPLVKHEDRADENPIRLQPLVVVWRDEALTK